MTKEEKEEEVENMRLSMGMLPKAIMLAMKKRGKKRDHIRAYMKLTRPRRQP